MNEGKLTMKPMTASTAMATSSSSALSSAANNSRLNSIPSTTTTTTISNSLEQSCFLSPHIPEEVKMAIPYFRLLPLEALRAAVTHVASVLMTASLSQFSFQKTCFDATPAVSLEQFLEFKELMESVVSIDKDVVLSRGDSSSGTSDSNSNSGGLVAKTAAYRTTASTLLDNNTIHIGILFSALYSILLHAVVIRTKLSTIDSDLRIMNVPVTAVAVLCAAVNHCRQTLDERLLGQGSLRTAATAATTTTTTAKGEAGMLDHRPMTRMAYPKLERFRWRVDVTLANSSLSKIMRPSITMQLLLGDGTASTFEVSVEQFNQLRFGVAKLLHEMRVIERHPIMRITDEFLKREKEESSR